MAVKFAPVNDTTGIVAKILEAIQEKIQSEPNARLNFLKIPRNVLEIW